MGRRLTQDELVTQIQQAVTELRAQLDVPPASGGGSRTAAAADQFGQRQVGWGRLTGLYEAWGFVADQARWGAAAQARAHDALTQRIHAVWLDRAHTLVQGADAVGYERHARETLDLPDTDPDGRARDRAALSGATLGHLDALRAASAALAGRPERLQALADLGRPERARQATRERQREVGLDA